MKSRASLLLISLSFVMVSAVGHSAEKKQILILNSYHKGYSWTDGIVEGIEKTFTERIENCEILIEYMDSKRINTDEYNEAFFRLMKIKYTNINLDIIIVSDDNAFLFAVKYHRSLFGDTPIVFVGVNHFTPSMIDGHEGKITGIVQDANIPATLNTALKLHPDITQVAVICDATTTGQAYIRQAAAAESQFETLKFIYLDGTELTTSEMLARLTSLPDNSIALLCIWLKDRNGVFVPWERGYPDISKNSAVPLYGVLDSMLQYGILGGKVQSGKHHGEKAAEIALKLLEGQKVADIPVRLESPNTYMFNYQQLQRWNIPETSLPQGSIILNEPQSVYYQYKNIVLGIIGTFAFLIVVITVLISNIIRRKSAEEKLRGSEQNYRLLIENLPGTVFRGYKDWSVEFFDNTIEIFTDYNVDEFNSRRMKWIDIIVEEDIDTAKLSFIQALKTNKSYIREYRITSNVEGIRWVQERGQIICDNKGEIEYVNGVFFDVTDRKQAEDALRESEERFKDLSNMLPQPLWETDLEGNFTYANRAGYESFGYTRKDFEKGVSIADVIIPEDRERRLANFGKTLRGIEFENHEYTCLTKDGRKFPALIYNSPIIKDGEPYGVRGVILDITNLKKAELELQRSEIRYRTLYQESMKREQLYESLLKSTPDAVAIYNLNGEATYINPAFTQIFGFTMQDVKGKQIPFMLESEAEKTIAGIKQVLEGESVSGFETKRRTKNGRVLDITLSSACYNDHEGNRAGIVVFLRDVTEAKETERQLQQVQKMESIGTLAGGIAHDFNNMLGIIVGNTELAMDDVPEWNPARQNLEEIRTASMRARDMVKQILAFSRKTPQKMKPVKIIPIIKESLKLLRSSIPTTIEIHQNISSESDTVLADPTQINQVIINLCTNAAHAMGEKGGVLEVGLEDIELDAGSATYYHDLSPGKYIKLTVNDTGHGIEPKILKRIFDPYFTTKNVGEGSGMGLSVVHGIIKSHGGGISVSSEPGKGTVFHILFPCIEDESEPEVEIAVEVPRGEERILFVDDEKAMVDTIQPMIERLGYKVTARTSSIEALEAFRANPDRFDLVITDFTMPNMTGLELTKELLKLRSDIPIILCTGYSEHVNEDKAKARGVRAFLMKPVVLGEIAKTIRKILDDD
jgi:two-component system, cell cycle sensor histidine kinase and response regulator CckA